MLTKRGLPWLKQIKESHGSVALTTMIQVEAINSSGIYYIADSEKTKESKHVVDSELCLENLVSLVVPKDEIKNWNEKIYSLEEIKDVQSKLMLIAGKAESGKDKVDQFNQVCILQETMMIEKTHLLTTPKSAQQHRSEGAVIYIYMYRVYNYTTNITLAELVLFDAELI
jgi:hypothetical protein